jgi:hypothetical protein
MGQTQRWRVVLAGRLLHGEAYLVVLVTPDSIARAAPEMLAALVNSISPN